MVAQDETFMVTITDTGFGADKAIGQVEETLPAGFSYVDGSATKVVGHATKGIVRGTVDATDSRIVTFTVVSVESFTYEVMVGADVLDGEHSFSSLNGDSIITVGDSAPPPGDGPSRELPAGLVAQNETFIVTITDTGYGADKAIGQVEETLPAGFSYVDGSATKVVGHATKGIVRGTVDATDSRIVTFTVVSVESFTYEVMVGADVPDGDHMFSGAGGDATITVGTRRAPRPDPRPNRPSEPSPNRKPAFQEEGMVSRSVAEDSTSGTNVGEPVAAEDPDGDTVVYTLSDAADAGSFAIDQKTGQITVGAATALDYETKDTYSVRVSVTDPSNAASETEVTISVINVDEAGTVSLSSMEPEAGSALTATLSDPDGSVSGVTWLWAKSSNQSAWTDISGATSATYTPVAGDGENYLQATATYTDGHGAGKSAEAVSANAVHVPNTAPSFSSTDSGVRSVAENTPSGEDVGDPATATDADNDPLTYTLSGADADSFEIDASNGQLKTKDALDYESRTSYGVTVTVSDGRGGGDSIAVTIVVTDVDETPPPTATPRPTVAPRATPRPTVAPTATPQPTVAPTVMPEPTVMMPEGHADSRAYGDPEYSP